jgi:hypothetical protein
MTYQEKYTELYDKYQKATTDLTQATQKISQYSGFGDKQDLGDYFKAASTYKYAEQNFQKFLNYSVRSKVNPGTEYVPHEFMYEYIKKDQQKKGIPWSDDVVVPEVKEGGITFAAVEVGLTNDPEPKKMYQGTEYKFPVLNLEHGKECFDYLSKMIMGQEAGELDIQQMRDKKIIDEQEAIYVRIELDIRK